MSNPETTPLPVGVQPLPEKPRLNRRFRLQWEPVQDAHVLLYPEGMVKLNTTAAAILLTCDGERDVAAIVRHLESQFEADDLYADVTGWLVTASLNGWVE